MKFFLNLKHWQVFIILFVGLALFNLTIENNVEITLVLTIVGAIAYSLWPIVLGNELNQLLPKKVKLNYNLFLINIFICLVVFVGSIIIAYGETLRFTGIYALPFFYVAYAYLYCLAFPAKALKSIELGREASLGDYIGDFFLIWFLPIGIWFIQPRINKIANKQLVENKIQEIQ